MISLKKEKQNKKNEKRERSLEKSEAVRLGVK